MTDARKDTVTLLAREIAAATEPLELLEALHKLDGWLTQAKEATVAQALLAKASWGDIGAALDVTRQSAHAKYRRLSPDAPTPVPEVEAPTVAPSTPQSTPRRHAVEEWALMTPGGRTLLRLVPTRGGPRGGGPRAAERRSHRS